MTLKIIQSDGMPPSKGHYSQCIEHNGTLYISGQLPVDADGRVPDTIQEQTLLVLNKAETIVKESGSTKDQIIQVRIYLSDIELWDQVNTVYAAFFGDHKPVRCVIPSGLLHYGCLIEIEVISAAGK